VEGKDEGEHNPGEGYRNITVPGVGKVVWIKYLPQRPMSQSLGCQPMVLLEGGRNFRR
jgi:hypothetical protein